MSFRRRMVLLAAGAVAAAVVLASVVVYVVTRDELRSGIDNSLRAKATPGLPQSVQILVKGSPAVLAKLKREGRLPPAASARGGQRALGRCRETGAKRDRARAARAKPWSRKPSRSKATRSWPARGPSTAHASTAVRVHDGSAAGTRAARLVVPTPGLGGAAGYAQLLRPNGQVLRSEEKGVLIPTTAATRAVAEGKQDAFFSDQTIAGTPIRVLAVPAAGAEFCRSPCP